MTPIALLIDFDGVLRRWSSDDSTIENRYFLPVNAIRGAAFSPELLTPAITGAVLDETWREQVATDLQKRHPQSQAHAAVAEWSASPGELQSSVLAVLSQCRPDLRLVLSSNATSRLPKDLRALGIASRFYAVANSSELGVSKPSTAYFEAALRKAEVRASEALFVDDSLSNVQAAEAVGMVTHHFTGAEALSTFLAKAGALGANPP